MANDYQSKFTRETVGKQNQDMMSTADLEKKVYGSEPGSQQTKMLDMSVSLAEYERRVQDAVLADYNGFERGAMKLCQRVGLPVVEWVQTSQIRQAQKDVRELEQVVGQYSKAVQQTHKDVTQYHNLQSDAGLLMNRHDAALNDLDVRLEELKKESGIAMAQSADNPRDNSYLQVERDISAVTVDKVMLACKRDGAAAKVLEYAACVKASEQALTYLLFMQQKHHAALIKAKETTTYLKLTHTMQVQKPTQAIKNLYGKEVRAAKRKTSSLEADKAFVDMMKATQDYPSVDMPEEEQDEVASELRKNVEEHNDRIVDRARRVLEFIRRSR